MSCRAIVPIVAVILFGGSTCCTAVNLLRLHGARQLRRSALAQHADLIQRIKAAKALGQRAAGRDEDAPRQLWVGFSAASPSKQHCALGLAVEQTK